MIEIPIIDLFAGPGGLSEGFNAYKENNFKFSTVLSIEKDFWAHKTLLLRHFFREFNSPPDEYYQYIKGKIKNQNDLFNLFPDNAKISMQKTWNAELGAVDDSKLNSKIKNNLKNSRHWVLLGGPPCQAYSTVGRARMKSNGKIFENDNRHYLYKHYLKILAKHRPTVFILENVKGLLSSKIKGQYIFHKILQDLRLPGKATGLNGAKYNIFPLSNYNKSSSKLGHYEYIPEDFIVKSEFHNIPQKRHRLIILGIIEDYKIEPEKLLNLDTFFTTHDAIGDIKPIRSILSKQNDNPENWTEALCREYVCTNLKDCSRKIKDLMDSYIDYIQTKKIKTGSCFVEGKPNPKILHDWIYDARLNGFCNHESRAHMDPDLLRYLFTSCYGIATGVSPKLRHFPKALLPKHKNVTKAISSISSYFSDRFRVQLKNSPSTTVTSHLHKDGHGFIHYDPFQCRSLSVREAARLQTFPDNYYFEGPRTQQFLQVGNAVPPFLAHQIAFIVKNIFLKGIYCGRYNK